MNEKRRSYGDRICVTAGAILFVFGLCLHAALARQPLPLSKEDARGQVEYRYSTAQPTVNYSQHNIGNLQLAIANNGTFGTFGRDVVDPETGERIQSCIYPRNSDIVHLWVGAFWLGAIVGRDTLVSVGTEDFYLTDEFWPDPPPFDRFEHSSIDINSPDYATDAYSEQDIFCTYTDTVTNPALVETDPADGRPHHPLNVKVSQRSMAWSFDYADDFVLFDYDIVNIGTQRLQDVYMGIFVDGDVWHTSRNGPEGWNDDIVGFYPSHPAPEGCGFIDTVNIAYTADNDGDPDPDRREWDARSARSVVGARVVRTPSDSLRYSFNWWIINYSDASRDFGPRRVGVPGDPYRNFGPRMGTPVGDRNRYYIMAHEEFDYDLLFTAIDHTSEGWFPPPAEAENYATGFDTRFLLSFGPFHIDPGQHLPISLIWVAGNNFHTNPQAFESFVPLNPAPYYEQLNFSEIALNARWASWVYDNPGVDTDSDGYRGKSRICAADTIGFSVDTSYTGGEVVFDTVWQFAAADTFWYEGDGVPDFRGAGPPPAPKLRVVPEVGKFAVRWNGYYSETTPDVFLNAVDFEGYRVYMSLDDRPRSFVLLQSYDIDNYNRYVWQNSGPSGWHLDGLPITRDSLRILYGTDFEPLDHGQSNPLTVGVNIYYFSPQDFNQSSLDLSGGIHKAYPEAPFPGTDPSVWTEDDITDEHGEPLPRYYEYEFVVDSVLSTVPYYLAVTTFDFGSPVVGVSALETAPINNSIREYAQTSWDVVEAEQLDAYVYPNPYRIDGGYTSDGYENREGRLATERARRIHFANLPKVCTIRIYSLDGDLVREIDHNHPEGGPESSHETWDLITRNTQATVSGLYYFVVESAVRTQIGKLMILK